MHTRARRAANRWVSSPCFDMEVVVSMLPCHWYPGLAPLVPPQAIGALILSRTVAQFHPAAIHFVSTQTQLPDSCDQAASLSEEIEVLNEAAFFAWSVCVCGMKKGSTYSVGIHREVWASSFFWLMTDFNFYGCVSLTNCTELNCFCVQQLQDIHKAVCYNRHKNKSSPQI